MVARREAPGAAQPGSVGGPAPLEVIHTLEGSRRAASARPVAPAVTAAQIARLELYLTGKATEGWFGAEEAELLGALAVAAGAAIDNARLHQAAQRRQRWLEVSAEVVDELLAGESDPLPLIAARSRQVADADLATVLVPLADEPGVLLVAAADGVSGANLRGSLVPREGSLAGQVLAEGCDLLVDDAPAAGGVDRSAVIRSGPAVVVRVRGAGGGQPGVLVLSRESGGRRFSLDEGDMAAGFACHVGLALELAHAQEARRQLLMFADRDRIARDLHDLVIQRLFATGLGMNSLAGRTGEPATRMRLGEFTDDLDETIRAIRQAIFQLHHARDGAGLRAQVFTAVRDVTPALGCTPALRLDGPLDDLVSSDLAGHALAVLREALTNVARHAHATTVSVSVSVDQRHLLLAVSDDGVGVGDPRRISGLASMRSRADQLGGSCTISSPVSPDGRGTRMQWAVPLEHQAGSASG